DFFHDDVDDLGRRSGQPADLERVNRGVVADPHAQLRQRGVDVLARRVRGVAAARLAQYDPRGDVECARAGLSGVDVARGTVGGVEMTGRDARDGHQPGKRV